MSSAPTLIGYWDPKNLALLDTDRNIMLVWNIWQGGFINPSDGTLVCNWGANQQSLILPDGSPVAMIEFSTGQMFAYFGVAYEPRTQTLIDTDSGATIAKHDAARGLIMDPSGQKIIARVDPATGRSRGRRQPDLQQRGRVGR